MTTPIAESMEAPAEAKPASRWEDFIDIFYTPSTVYERRKNQSPWPTLWIVTILLFVVTFLTFNAMSPVVENELREQAVKAMAKNPQMTQDMADMSVRFGMGGRRWGTLAFPIIALVMALIVWVLGKIVGARQSYRQALAVLTYASIIGVVAALVMGAQALVLDVSGMTSVDQLSLSAARFVDKAATSPFLYGILKQLDVFGIWGVIVMAIGMRVTGNLTRQRAIAWGVIWWSIGALIMALIAMRAAAG